MRPKKCIFQKKIETRNTKYKYNQIQKENHLLPFDHVNVGLPPCSHLFHKQSCWLDWTNLDMICKIYEDLLKRTPGKRISGSTVNFLEAYYRVNNSMEDSHWHLRYRSQVLEIWLETGFKANFTFGVSKTRWMFSMNCSRLKI